MRIINMLYLAVFLLSGTLSNAQSEVLGLKKDLKAVIIGISDYKDENIPDLQFASKDAQVFYNTLLSTKSGATSTDYVKLLLDEQATTANVAKALDGLIENCTDGDVAFIYFSGHGDVETKTLSQHGFLLTHDSPASVYIAGAYPLFYLQSVIATLSDKGVKVIMISDACRAGKLAGSAIGGTGATTTALARQFSNEVKILSCQPNEFSLEGTQWGKGRGLFSYHLVNGICGLADINEDSEVTLLELENYLEENVSKEAYPESQIPMTVGLKSTVISKVDEQLIEKILINENSTETAFQPIISKGIEEIVLASASESTQQMYADFLKLTESKDFILPKEKNAMFLFDQLIENEEIKRLHNLMRRNLAASLQSEYQDFLIALLHFKNIKSYPGESQRDIYRRYQRYLEIAIDLIGKHHYLYNEFYAKKLFVESRCISMSISYDALASDSLFLVAKAKLDTAGQYLKESAFIFFEYGRLYFNWADVEDGDDLNPAHLKTAEGYFKKAIEMAPTWVSAYDMLVSTYSALKDYDSAENTIKKAIDMKPDYAMLYDNYAWVLKEQGKFHEAAAKLRKGISVNPKIGYLYFSLGDLFTYKLQDSIELAGPLFKKATELMPYFFRVHERLGTWLLFRDRLDEAEPCFQKALEIRPFHDWSQFRYAELHARRKNKAGFLEYMEKALQNGFKNFDRLKSDGFADEYLDSPEWIQLREKYTKQEND